MILLFYWIIAYCKTTKRIGTLNFTNINLPFVVINLLMFVCLSININLPFVVINLLMFVYLSIAGHTTQGFTGSGMLCTTYLALGVPLGNG